MRDGAERRFSPVAARALQRKEFSSWEMLRVTSSLSRAKA
jgi:hypothetical protein